MLGVTPQQRVLNLNACQYLVSAITENTFIGIKLLRRNVADPEESDFALLNQIHQSTSSFFDRDLWIWLMKLVQIDIVRSQPAETGLCSVVHQTSGSSTAIWLTLAGHAEFRGDDNFVAMACQSLSKQFFRSAVPVYIGSVEEAYPPIECGTDDGFRLRRIQDCTQAVAAQPNRTHRHCGVGERPLANGATSPRR